MIYLQTTRWVLLDLARAPLAWLGVLTLAAVGPLLARLAPVGLTTAGDPAAAPLYEVAFWSALVGAALGLGPLERGRWFLAPLAPARRASLEWVGLLTAELAVVVPVLALAALLGPRPDGPLLLGAFLAGVHLAVLASLLLRTPLPAAGRRMALPLLAWIAPALLAGLALPGPALARLLDAHTHLAFPPANDPATAHSALALLPIIGLALADGLLCRPDAIRRPG